MSAGIQYTCSETPAASISDCLPMYADGSTEIWSRRNMSFLTLLDRTLVVYEKFFVRLEVTVHYRRSVFSIAR